MSSYISAQTIRQTKKVCVCKKQDCSLLYHPLPRLGRRLLHACAAFSNKKWPCSIFFSSFFNRCRAGILLLLALDFVDMPSVPNAWTTGNLLLTGLKVDGRLRINVCMNSLTSTLSTHKLLKMANLIFRLSAAFYSEKRNIYLQNQT